jgi:N-acetylmuramoyl-L-alanine amidase
MAPGAVAIVKSGRTLGLEVSPPRGISARSFLQKYLAIEMGWSAYEGRMSAFVPFERLKQDVQREVLLAVYPEDVVTSDGWTHRVQDDRETLLTLSEWLTGEAANSRTIMKHGGNDLDSINLRAGQLFVVPIGLLRTAMRAPTPERAAPPPSETHDTDPNDAGLLAYGSDRKGKYAAYRLRKDENLFTSVVVRFTDISETADVRSACNLIEKRNRIRDTRDMKIGQEIRIPLGLLSDRYLPEGTRGRTNYEAAVQATQVAKSARRNTVRPIGRRALLTKVVILDPGHGGNDPGATFPPGATSGLLEDEINYDIVCRTRELLENAGMKVYMTMVDRNQGLNPTKAKSFRHDEDEELTTNPPYKNDRIPPISAYLRWMRTNAIYQEELRKGTLPEDILFISVHTDSIMNSSVRGSMIYVPDAVLRRKSEVGTRSIYARYEEGRNFNRYSATVAETIRDESMSRAFAEVLLEELGKKRIKRHDRGDPIRSKIRRRNKVFVPAVIRFNKVPTKVLIEAANLVNPTDRKWVSDPWWRQQFSLAITDAVKRHFGTSQRTALAMTD